MPERYEAVVIGTGFGGAITACRLSQKWPGKVLVLERGKRYPMGSFPHTPHDTARNFGNVPNEGRSRPNAFREPPDEVFDERWPESCKKTHLMPYSRVAKEVLGSRPIPRNGDPRRQIVRTEVFEQAAKVPVNATGEDDPQCHGEHGYHIYYRDLTAGPGHQLQVAFANRVIVSAGTLGTNELLLRCHDVTQTLPAISRKLGHSYSGNGDFLSFVVQTDRPANPDYGPVITQRTDYNLFHNFDPQRAFLMQDASYPAFAAWFTEGAKPGLLRSDSIWRLVKDSFRRFVLGQSTSSMGYALHDLLTGDLSHNTCVLLCMGIDKSDGRHSFNSFPGITMTTSPQPTSLQFTEKMRGFVTFGETNFELGYERGRQSDTA